MGAYIVVAIIAYLIGSVSFAIIFGKKFGGIDVRTKGSGNAGSTNVLRTVGKKAALCSVVCDILKGVVAVLIAVIISKIFKSTDGALLVQIAALCVVIGHTFPIFYGFKGGKGVATSLGVLLIINWEVGLVCFVFAIAIMAVTRMVSLGSISAAVLFAVLCLFKLGKFIVDGNYLIFGLLLAAFVIFNHRTNIVRIKNGTENKLSFKKKEEPEEKAEEEAKDEPEVKEPLEIKVEEEPEKENEEETDSEDKKEE